MKEILRKDKTALQMGHLYVSFTWCLLFSLPVHAISSASDSTGIKTSELKARAIQYDRKHDVYNAIIYYNLYLHHESRDIKLSYRLATLYFSTRDYSNACNYYDSVIDSRTRKYPLAYFYKGMVCMNLQQYDQAVECFTRFRKVYKKQNRNRDYRKLAALYSESSVWAKNQSDTLADYEISHPGASINHANIDFSPFPVDDHHIYYGAVYTGIANDEAPVRQIFKAEKVNGDWKGCGRLDDQINDPSVNTGNAALSADGQRMYFTRTSKNWQDHEICEIYMSRFDGKDWQCPEKLPYPVNDQNYTSTQPAIGKNLRSGNDILYFVSDRRGGKGGLDIWQTEYDYKTKVWKEPVPLDRSINSPGDEMCPFYDVSQHTLYFSSNGRKNALGGYDIYKAGKASKKWMDAVPMPKPINSSYDDYYFTQFKNGKEGFFTSNRPGSMTFGNGSCCDDLYAFKLNECARVHAAGSVMTADNEDLYEHLKEKYQLKFDYPKSHTALPAVPVELYLSDKEGQSEILISTTETDQHGQYSFELQRNQYYRILVKNYGYFEKKLTLNSMGLNCSDKLALGVVPINYLPRASFQVNIYYDHDKYRLSDQAEKTIDTTLMPLFDLFPNAVIEIGSHTDNTGTDSYNLKLSQRRSESVVNYLISKGISSERLVARGYGMQFPVAPNTHTDGSDNPDGRQLNRRTEIRVVGEITQVNQAE
jgi:OmpA-OmpF porin, OOP family